MTDTTHAVTTLTSESVALWVDAYLKAWTTNAETDIAALFSGAAEYHESPYETKWVGRDAIVDGWRSRWDWQKGGWNFEWSLSSITGSTVVITGVGRYKELGDFDNVWTVTFEASGRAARFEMLNTERD